MLILKSTIYYSYEKANYSLLIFIFIKKEEYGWKSI
nr:MAG TPA: hypothetical protein [Caudoviricetes sp.]